MNVKTDDSSVRITIWFSRILRWSLGIFFMSVGVWYYGEGGWPAILFGLVLVITGFFRPKRCLVEQNNTCNSSSMQIGTHQYEQ